LEDQHKALQLGAHLFVPTKAVLVVIKVEVLLQSKESPYKGQTRHCSLVPPLPSLALFSPFVPGPASVHSLLSPIHPKLHRFLLLSVVSSRTTGAPSCPSQFLCQEFLLVSCCCTAGSLYFLSAIVEFFCSGTTGQSLICFMMPC
jgi:hypothetical protein